MLRSRPHPFLAGAAIAASIIVLAACVTDYQKGLDDPRYGPPNGLLRQDQAEAGAPSAPACVTAGQSLAVAEGGTCAVTFKSILATFKTVNCNATPGCHGGPNPTAQPLIDTDDPDGTWRTLANYVIQSSGKPYINPCSTDPASSSITCNLNKDAPCGNVMPNGSTVYPPDGRTAIETWLKCGAPNN
jgi:hypothetical protein